MHSDGEQQEVTLRTMAPRSLHGRPAGWREQSLPPLHQPGASSRAAGLHEPRQRGGGRHLARSRRRGSQHHSEEEAGGAQPGARAPMPDVPPASPGGSVPGRPRPGAESRPDPGGPASQAGHPAQQPMVWPGPAAPAPAWRVHTAQPGVQPSQAALWYEQQWALQVQAHQRYAWWGAGGAHTSGSQLYMVQQQAHAMRQQGQIPHHLTGQLGVQQHSGLGAWHQPAATHTHQHVLHPSPGSPRLLAPQHVQAANFAPAALMQPNHKLPVHARQEVPQPHVGGAKRLPFLPPIHSHGLKQPQLGARHHKDAYKGDGALCRPEDKERTGGCCDTMMQAQL